MSVISVAPAHTDQAPANASNFPMISVIGTELVRLIISQQVRKCARISEQIWQLVLTIFHDAKVITYNLLLKHWPVLLYCPLRAVATFLVD